MAILRLFTVLATCALFDAVTSARTAGCGKELGNAIDKGGTGSSNNITITTSDGTERSYLLHLPRAYNDTRSHGLIFSFHGRGEDASQQEKVSRFSEASVNPHMLVAYPQGISKQWQGDPAASTDDVAFTLDMIDQISEQYCIDSDKIYATGKSNGGGLAANILACDPVASTKIAAFGGFAGAYYQGDGNVKASSCDADAYPITCNPGRDIIPIFETHGSADSVIPYDGGPQRSRCLPSLPHFMTDWSERNGLTATNDTTTTDNGKVVKYEWGQSEGLAGVNTHYWIKGLGHSWPDTVPNGDGCCSYINASMLVIDFFHKWTLSTTPTSLSDVTSSTTSSPTSTTATPSATSSAAASTQVPAASGSMFAQLVAILLTMFFAA